MLLQLKYNGQGNREVNAAFLPGVSPAAWFREMQLWHINLQTVRCFIMPQSIAVNESAGLFVIFHEKHVPAAQFIQYPYSMLAGKLFIPLKSTLYPVIGNDELKVLLLWELQVFHPFIGLVGFEKKDEIKLSSLIAIPQSKQNNWHMAHPGLVQPQGLRMIALEPEEFADVLDNIKEDVGSKPLDEIPDITAGEGSELPGSIKAILKSLSMIALFLLMVLGFIGKVLFFMFYAIFPSAKPVGNSQRKGWLQQLENWVNRKIADLDKQRDSELKRLMNMFDSDSDEALKYAIPLDSPYLNRGDGPKSGKLTRRNSLDFNLRRLGGGGRVDSWNVGDYHAKLRARYQQSAREAVDKGNFKKAAYIYAHLLGDFYSASTVLQQGKLYREAAALYKDHLKNNRMAAECLEKGGLLTEAIPLYIELDHTEKVGDLYMQLDQQENAFKYYDETLDRLKTGKHYQEAARLSMDKMNRKHQAQQLLLTGWEDTANPEACLKAYFEMSHEPEDDDLSHEVKKIYADHVPRLKRTSFLNVLADITQKYRGKQLEDTSLNIAYEIVHTQVENGEMSGLKLMNRFVPGDRLLTADANRFVSNNKQLPEISTKPTYLDFKNNTKCIDLVVYHDQILAIGLKGNDLMLMRANWNGKATYEFLFKWQPNVAFSLITGSISEYVILVGKEVPYLIDKKMESFTYFERGFFLKAFPGLPAGVIGSCISISGALTFLYHENGFAKLGHFSVRDKGELKASHHCKLDGEDVKFGSGIATPLPMVFRKEHFYYCLDMSLLRFDAKGNMEVLQIGANIIKFSVTGYHTSLKIALLTDQGCMVIIPAINEMRVRGDFFAQDFAATDIKILTDNLLIITGGNQAQVYDLSAKQPQQISTISTEKNIERIIASPKRHHCAFLEADNRISIYNMEGV
ncbi:hypothetical protein ACFFGT_06660 [Mucilaginibacter angelicae]|uniref:MoxR-vWA-beta-propeller ternary system domain-containing protein n=1 Tax=Mucilaginibacter angelicae TaxID=869718 RepID=A0ABV6L2B6_9SPHI